VTYQLVPEQGGEYSFRVLTTDSLGRVNMCYIHDLHISGSQPTAAPPRLGSGVPPGEALLVADKENYEVLFASFIFRFLSPRLLIVW
jgi:hypothetical protein